MAPQFTEAVTQAIEEAFQYAQGSRHVEVTENHLLRALLLDSEGYFASITSAVGLDPSLLLNQVETAIKSLPVYSGEPNPPQVNMGLQHKIQEAEKFAKAFHDTYISSDHLFLAYWDKPIEPFASWKKISKKSLKEVEAEIKKIRGSKHMDSPGAEGNLKALEKYCKNLTDLARKW